MYVSACMCGALHAMSVLPRIRAGAFMGVLADKALAELVDNVSEILAPVVWKALQSAPQPEPHTGWPTTVLPTTARKYKVPAELTHSGQRVLLMTAAGGFGPKLFPRCIPEHAAMVNGMERIINKLVPADHRGMDRPGQLTETEMCGILGAFDRMPLCVDEATGQVRSAAKYNLMDKGRGFLLWGYATQRLVCSDLSPAMFATISGMQQKNNKGKEVKEALGFFGASTASAFNALQGHVREAASHAARRMVTAMGARPAVPGGPAQALPGGAAAWQIHWPTLFVHCCEVKQALNMLGRADMEVAVQHRVASLRMLRHCFVEYSGHDPFMVVLVRHAMTAPARLSGKQPCKAFDKPAKRRKISKPTASSHQPATGGSSTNTSSTQTPPPSSQEEASPGGEGATSDSGGRVPRTPVDAQSEESPGSRAAVAQHLSDHGRPVEESMPAGQPPLPPPPSGRVRCQCSGMCAVGSPMCPARMRWSRPGRPAKGCTNYAVSRDPHARRHYCLSCLCRAPGCPNPRRRGLYCGTHAVDHEAPPDVFLGWASTA